MSTVQPTSPEWPRNVLIFHPNDPLHEMQQKVAISASLTTTASHFSSERYALLFHKGVYPLDVPVGYYTQVLGLAENCADVIIGGIGQKGVYCPAADPTGCGSLDTFWRAAENLTSNAPNTMWAVSQAAPLRRVIVSGGLTLFDSSAAKSESSGGFCANVTVSGIVEMGSQQQWMMRNCSMQGVNCHVWNYVFVGCIGAPMTEPHGVGASPNMAITNVPTTPLCAEKPYITCSISAETKEEAYFLQVPQSVEQTTGPLSAVASKTRTISFQNVFVAQNDNFDRVQHMLDRGLDIVICPGIYHLAQPLHVRTSNQVILGIGMATLVAAPNSFVGCIRVDSGLEGVRVAGLMLQAAKGDPGKNRYLILWGCDESENNGLKGVSKSGLFPGNPKNPSVLSDVFCRIGGPDLDRTVNVHTMIGIFDGHVIGDNLWLWRADHSALALGEVPDPGEKYHLIRHLPDGTIECDCKTALHVQGDDVTMYGLAAEHTVSDLTLWAGNRGRTYFYQSELPYDTNTDQFGKFCGYKVLPSATEHTAWGVGVYSYFRDFDCFVETAISIPPSLPFHRIVHPFTVLLRGKRGIKRVVNAMGPFPSGAQEGEVCFFNPLAYLQSNDT